MKPNRRSVAEQLSFLIADETRAKEAIAALESCLSPKDMSSPLAFSKLDHTATDDLERLIAAILSALRLQTWPLHDPKIKKLRRELKRREEEKIRDLKQELGLAGRWLDHLSALDLDSETYFVAEPYVLEGKDFSNFTKLQQSGWLVRVFLPLSTYFPTRAVPVMFRKRKPGELPRDEVP